MTDYYAFHDGKLYHIGEFETFDEADEACEREADWIFTGEDLDALYERIQELRHAR